MAFAHQRHYFDDAYTREWFDIMQNEFYWIHPRSGEPIKHWPAYFRLWRINRNAFEKLRELRRSHSSTSTQRIIHADNWIGTPKEDIENVL